MDKIGPSFSLLYYQSMTYDGSFAKRDILVLQEKYLEFPYTIHPVVK